ncbi:MAG: hypothetical protein AAF438_04960 [Pseudomonadota bacterium]
MNEPPLASDKICRSAARIKAIADTIFMQDESSALSNEAGYQRHTILQLMDIVLDECERITQAALNKT